MVTNSNYAEQIMEVLVIYFALLDNRKSLTLTKYSKRNVSKNLNIHVRGDSNSTVQHLIGKGEIRDVLI